VLDTFVPFVLNLSHELSFRLLNAVNLSLQELCLILVI